MCRRRSPTVYVIIIILYSARPFNNNRSYETRVADILMRAITSRGQTAKRSDAKRRAFFFWGGGGGRVAQTGRRRRRGIRNLRERFITTSREPLAAYVYRARREDVTTVRHGVITTACDVRSPVYESARRRPRDRVAHGVSTLVPDGGGQKFRRDSFFFFVSLSYCIKLLSQARAM